MSLPDCPHCAVPVGEGTCAGCVHVRGQEVNDAHDAVDIATVDAEWMESRLGDDWRDGVSLHGLVVLADKALAANPLNPAAVDRRMSECAPFEREQSPGSDSCSRSARRHRRRTDPPRGPPRR